MNILSENELVELRCEIAHLDIPLERQNAIIHLIDNIIISLLDQARGMHAVQLSLSSRANYAFSGAREYGNFLASEISETVDLPENDKGEGAITFNHPVSGRAGGECAP